jgi:hypothetical protein
MKQLTPLFRTPLILASLAVGPLAAQGAENVDADAIALIRDEGLNRSEVMETLFWLTDRHGPRLTGSPAFEAAGDWAIRQLDDWGVANAHKERFPFGKGWSLVRFHATMTEPQVMPIIAMPKAWTPGTDGIQSAEVVRVDISTQEDLEQYRGKLRGKIVLTQPAREVRMLEGRLVLRMTEEELAEARTAPAPRARRGRAVGAQARRGGRGNRGGRRGGGRRGAGRGRVDVNAFYKAEGVVALFDRGSNNDTSAGGSDLSWRTQRTDGGTLFVGSGGSRGEDAGAGLPQVTLAVEHYNRMVRLVEHDVPVTVELEVETSFRDETQLNGFNVVAEIPGSDLADQSVLIGAHFDSWHGATGATDNGTGIAAMMEVMRIIRATGLQPRRTIRIGLWGAEENGLIGSRVFATRHLGTAEEPKPGLAKLSAYFNIDNGTGRIRGIWMQGNSQLEPIFAQWITPLSDLGVEVLGPRSVGGTDHGSFDRLGVPAFQFTQERLEYNSRTHHSNMDFYDRVQADDVVQMATVATVFTWLAANRDEMLPRK